MQVNWIGHCMRIHLLVNTLEGMVSGKVERGFKLQMGLWENGYMQKLKD